MTYPGEQWWYIANLLARYEADIKGVVTEADELLPPPDGRATTSRTALRAVAELTETRDSFSQWHETVRAAVSDRFPVLPLTGFEAGQRRPGGVLEEAMEFEFDHDELLAAVTPPEDDAPEWSSFSVILEMPQLGSELGASALRLQRRPPSGSLPSIAPGLIAQRLATASEVVLRNYKPIRAACIRMYPRLRGQIGPTELENRRQQQVDKRLATLRESGVLLFPPRRPRVVTEGPNTATVTPLTTPPSPRGRRPPPRKPGPRS